MSSPDPGPAPDESAPPEREPDRRHPSTVGGALYLVVLLATAVRLAVTVTGDWRLGVRILSGALAGASAARLVLPSRDAGMLAVRHRAIDVGLLASVAAVLWALTVSIPDQPGN